MNSAQDTRYRVGCPIRTSRDHRSLASPPGFSQRATSFIASQCQGIHQMPLLALDPRRNQRLTHGFRRTKPPRTGAKPPRQTASHEDTSRICPSLAAQAYPPRSHDKLSLHPIKQRARTEWPRTAISPNLLQTPVLSALLAQHLSRRRNFVATVVEVNGFEPMTSCLQSRRSPS
jgi:hypothetical protein